MQEQPNRSGAFTNVPTCPLCLEPTGRARAVTVRGPKRFVQYVCDRCTHTWEVSTEEPSQLLFSNPPG